MIDANNQTLQRPHTRGGRCRRKLGRCGTRWHGPHRPAPASPRPLDVSFGSMAAMVWRTLSQLRSVQVGIGIPKKVHFDDEAFDGRRRRSVGKANVGMADLGECRLAAQVPRRASRASPRDDSWIVASSRRAAPSSAGSRGSRPAARRSGGRRPVRIPTHHSRPSASRCPADGHPWTDQRPLVCRDLHRSTNEDSAHRIPGPALSPTT